MNAADLARLDLAKRAYQAAQPNENEVQTGVRRARLALGRPKPRRAWFSKGLVFVVLAVGSLAYAKPHALGELVEKALAQADAHATRSGVGAAAVRLPPEAATRPQGADKPRANAAPLGANPALLGVAPLSAAPLGPSARATTSDAAANSARDIEPHGPTASRSDAATSRSPATPAKPLAAVANSAAASKKLKSSRLVAAPSVPTAAGGASDVAAVSDWGRVGQALARGDETQALSALDGLSRSDDRRTRDKADLGRAQLLIAHGDGDRACALARALTNRRAGSRIERQAQALLKSCPR